MRALVIAAACLAGCFDFDALDRFPPDAPGASGPVVFDTAIAPSSLCTSSPCEHVHPVGPGANGIIVIWYYCASSALAASAVTSDGIPAQSVGAASFANRRGELWYALASTSTSHAISVSHGCPEAYVASMSATHVDQAAPVRASTFDGSDSETLAISDTVASAPNDLVMDGVCTGIAVADAASQQSLRYEQNISGIYPCGAFAGSSQPGASPTVSTTWTASTADFWVFMGLSLKPAGS